MTGLTVVLCTVRQILLIVTKHADIGTITMTNDGGAHHVTLVEIREENETLSKHATE